VSLKQIRSLCQCQSDDDKNSANKQLANSEELLNKLENKYNGIGSIRMIDVSVNRLPSNWRAAMLKIARQVSNKEEMNDNECEKLENNGEVSNGSGDHNKIESRVDFIDNYYLI
jgi:hypothetical protein